MGSGTEMRGIGPQRAQCAFSLGHTAGGCVGMGQREAQSLRAACFSHHLVTVGHPSQSLQPCQPASCPLSPRAAGHLLQTDREWLIWPIKKK